MKIIKPSFELIDTISEELMLRKIEQAARTCYKSEDKITADSAKKMVKSLIKSGHHSVLEHVSISVKIVCDRGVSHELVRHRLASYSQESTRYANYGKEKFGREITVIRPNFWPTSYPLYVVWRQSCLDAELAYMTLLDRGAKAQEARSVLPNSLKTDIVITANIREWRHIFNLRCGKAAHPQIRQIMLPLLGAFYQRLPVLFEAQYEKYQIDIDKTI
jgi:thymidylate synthase (FAD)